MLAVEFYLHNVWYVSQVRALYAVQSNVPHITHKSYSKGLDAIHLSLLDQGFLTVLEVKWENATEK